MNNKKDLKDGKFTSEFSKVNFKNQFGTKGSYHQINEQAVEVGYMENLSMYMC